MSKLRHVVGVRTCDTLDVLPLEVIAHELGVSRQRVHAIYTKAMAKCRIEIRRRYGIEAVIDVLDYEGF